MFSSLVLLSPRNVCLFSVGSEVPQKPLRCAVRDLLKRSRFFEQMRGAGDDRQFLRTMKKPEGGAVHLDDRFVVAADEQQSGSCRVGEVPFGEMRSPTARND